MSTNNKASVSRTVKFISKSGTYSAYIISPAGDLFQDYEDQTTGTQVSPSFEDSSSPFYQPLLNLIVTNSRMTNAVTPADVDFYVGDSKIVFDAATGVSTGILSGSNVNTDYAGVFKKVVPGSGQLYYGLRILKNLPEIVGWASVIIKMVAKVNPANSTKVDEISVTYTIRIQQKTGDTARVMITSPDNFAITAKGGTCQLKALVIKGGQQINSGWAFTWYQLESTGWVQKATGTTITVNEADVQTSALFRVKATAGGEDLYDVATIIDASDPYDIEPCPVPEDETIEEDTAGNGQIVYTPKLVSRKTKAPVAGAQFNFILTDYAGNILNPTTQSTALTTFTVTRADCTQGEDLSLTIIAI